MPDAFPTLQYLILTEPRRNAGWQLYLQKNGSPGREPRFPADNEKKRPRIRRGRSSSATIYQQPIPKRWQSHCQRDVQSTLLKQNIWITSCSYLSCRNKFIIAVILAKGKCNPFHGKRPELIQKKLSWRRKKQPPGSGQLFEIFRFQLRKPSMILASASCSVRPRVRSFRICSPAILPMAAS